MLVLERWRCLVPVNMTTFDVYVYITCHSLYFAVVLLAAQRRQVSRRSRTRYDASFSDMPVRETRTIGNLFL
jgi:hypothetical protein